MIISPRFGLKLLRDRRVPIKSKLIALGIGAVTVAGIEIMQLPAEGIMAALLPFVGVAGDLALDGMEALVGPVVIATLLLPKIAPFDIVNQIRVEADRMAAS